MGCTFCIFRRQLSHVFASFMLKEADAFKGKVCVCIRWGRHFGILWTEWQDWLNPSISVGWAQVLVDFALMLGLHSS